MLDLTLNLTCPSKSYSYRFHQPFPFPKYENPKKKKKKKFINFFEIGPSSVNSIHDLEKQTNCEPLILNLTYKFE